MKITLIIVIIIISTGLIYFFYLGYKSQTGIAKGLVNSKLAACSKKPNCICTEFPQDISHFSPPLHYPTADSHNIAKAIESIGGTITTSKEHYIAATFTSRLFRYVDDFEIRIDTENQLIHIRSASRVGHSDMGANLKRLEKFKRALRQHN